VNKFLLSFLAALVGIGMVTLVFSDGVAALAIVLVFSTLALLIFRHFTTDKEFVTKIFLTGLIVRLLFGIVIQVFDLRVFFGGDANTYDFRGYTIVEYWMGNLFANDPRVLVAASTNGPGWGMNYLVAVIYVVFGRNIFAAQSFCAVVGAAIAPMVYFCAQKLFQNIRVARISTMAVAFFPSFIIWSSQLLKDGLIVFLLVLTMTMVLQLQGKLSYASVVILLLSLFAIMSLRFYIFYMVATAVTGSFIIGVTDSVESIARRTIVLVVIGLGLIYFGVSRTASVDIERFGNLEQLQNSHLDLARSAESGYQEDVDVSTSEGALSALPLGFLYLMFAPFPWQVTNVRQAITLPEVLIWWTMVPVIIYGLWYTIRHRLRKAFPVLIFTLMLTLAYSIFLGNVGTAYRQRTQIQVFLFIFFGVGWTLYKEHKEDRKNSRRRFPVRGMTDIGVPRA
jgi:hypothetical protein